MKGQIKKHSVFESISNVVVGYLIALASQLIIFPFFNIYIPLSSNLLIGFWFTLISLARSYILRRVYNELMIKHGKT